MNPGTELKSIMSRLFNKKNTPAQHNQGPGIMTADQDKPNAPACVDANDGVTHINIDLNGGTELGRMCSNLADIGFVHPLLGSFASVEGFWAYVRSGGTDDSARYVKDVHAKRKSKEWSGTRGRKFKNFRDLIMMATWHKVDQNDHLYDLLLESTLPFDHYYLHQTTKIRIYPELKEMITGIMEDIRNHLQNGTEPTEPDYSELLDAIKANQAKS